MTSAKFQIGKDEKHTVEVDYSALTGKIKVTVDGKEITDSHHLWLGSKQYHFSVGEKEKHDVELKMGTYGHKFELLVDGKIQASA